MGLIYQKEQKINGYECLMDFKVQPTAVLNYFQQTSQEQSDALGVGPEALDTAGLAWFLVKYHIRFHRYPTFGDTVTVETEAMAFDKFAAHRRFALRDKTGIPMIEADTEWMLLNRKTNKLERLSNVDMVNAYGAGTESTFKLRRLAKADSWTADKQFQVRYLDIDFNGHVNHVKYLAWAIESLPLDCVRTCDLKEAKIIFKNQGFYGDIVTVKTCAVADDRWRMDIDNQNGLLLAQLELTVAPKEAI